MYIYMYVYTYIYIYCCLLAGLSQIHLGGITSNSVQHKGGLDGTGPCLPSSGRTLVEINRLVQGNIYRKPWVFATKKTGQLPEIFPTNSLLISMIELLCAGVLGWFVSLGTLDLG